MLCRSAACFRFMTNSMNNGLSLKAISKERNASTIELLNFTYNLFGYEELIMSMELVGANNFLS
ncbi:MAG: hypothetical protein PHH41_04835 [Sulfurimonas sp.]|nr:hypothetical protein [Sulfurimonas sp.]